MRHLSTSLLIASVLCATSARAQLDVNYDPRIDLGVELGMPLQSVLSRLAAGGVHVEKVDTTVKDGGATWFRVVARGVDGVSVCSLDVGALNGLYFVSNESWHLDFETASRGYVDRIRHFKESLGRPSVEFESDTSARCHWFTPPVEFQGTMTGVIRFWTETKANQKLYVLMTFVHDYPRAEAELALQKM